MERQLSMDAGLRRAVRFVALLNIGYFGIEFAMAVAMKSIRATGLLLPML